MNLRTHRIKRQTIDEFECYANLQRPSSHDDWNPVHMPTFTHQYLHKPIQSRTHKMTQFPPRMHYTVVQQTRSCGRSKLIC